MLKKERHNYILDYLNLHGTVIASELSDILNVSHDTIRRDLDELSDDGLLIRVHGGALLSRNEPILPPSNTAQIIGAKTVPLLYEDSFILTCGGDAVMEMYGFISPNFNATLLTANIMTAYKYSEHPMIDVVQIGDRVLKASKLTVGGEAVSKIRQIRADICILDAVTIDPVRGLTESDWQIAQIKNAMAESSDVIICLAASLTLGKIAAIQICAAQKITYLITELDPQDTSLDSYREMGIIVL